jgi:hypothetical protein
MTPSEPMLKNAMAGSPDAARRCGSTAARQRLAVLLMAFGCENRETMEDNNVQ